MSITHPSRVPGRRSRRFLVVVLVSAVAAACSPSAGTGQVDRGATLFHSRDLSSSDLNIFTCASCHDTEKGKTTGIKPGAFMAGVTRRPSFWGGMDGELLEAIDDCRRSFMNDRDALTRDDPAVAALYAFLVSLEPGEPAPVAFSVATYIEDVARGDADRGQTLFASACSGCHGEMHSGAGRLTASVPILPEAGVASHAGYDARTLRLVFIEKIRHGSFFGYSGVMPPFSQQVLSDSALGDILEALGIMGLQPASTSPNP